MRLFISYIFPLVFASIGYGQTVIGSVGLSTTTSGASIQGTIGEPIISTGANSNVILTQGFHQSKYDFAIVEEHNNLVVSNYPNPTTGITIFESNTPIYIVVYDLKGAILINQNQSLIKQTIDLSSLENGTYLVKIISDEENTFNTYKIIKN